MNVRGLVLIPATLAAFMSVSLPTGGDVAQARSLLERLFPRTIERRRAVRARRAKARQVARSRRSAQRRRATAKRRQGHQTPSHQTPGHEAPDHAGAVATRLPQDRPGQRRDAGERRERHLGQPLPGLSPDRDPADPHRRPAQPPQQEGRGAREGAREARRHPQAGPHRPHRARQGARRRGRGPGARDAGRCDRLPALRARARRARHRGRHGQALHRSSRFHVARRRGPAEREGARHGGRLRGGRERGDAPRRLRDAARAEGRGAFRHRRGRSAGAGSAAELRVLHDLAGPALPARRATRPRRARPHLHLSRLPVQQAELPGHAGRSARGAGSVRRADGGPSQGAGLPHPARRTQRRAQRRDDPRGAGARRGRDVPEARLDQRGAARDRARPAQEGLRGSAGQTCRQPGGLSRGAWIIPSRSSPWCATSSASRG